MDKEYIEKLIKVCLKDNDLTLINILFDLLIYKSVLRNYEVLQTFIDVLSEYPKNKKLQNIKNSAEKYLKKYKEGKNGFNAV